MLITSVDRGQQLETLRLAGQLTDVTILVEGMRVPAHKLVLALHSHYFRYHALFVPFLKVQASVLLSLVYIINFQKFSLQLLRSIEI
jgi:hypothetical protein